MKCVAQTDESARMRTMQPLYSRIPVVKEECERCVFQRVGVRVFFRSMRARSTFTPFFRAKKV